MRWQRSTALNFSGKATIRVIDSHTGGEPTRLVLAGAPALGGGSVQQQLQVFSRQHDWFRSAVVNEPRGSDVLVGALLCEPGIADVELAAIFFNNVGYLGMCGHGTIGLAVSLCHADRLPHGTHRLETPAGLVEVTLHNDHEVSVSNVASYRLHKDWRLEVPEIGTVIGDIAWGGNWFYLLSGHGQQISLANVEQLTDYAWTIRQQLDAQGVRGADGALIDHVELFGPPADSNTADSRNFVLCPGKAYDRSPCGTGTSAKLACLLADGQLAPGEVWRQQGITGSIFEASGQLADHGRIIPTIKGSAFVTSESTLLLDSNDPFVYGL